MRPLEPVNRIKSPNLWREMSTTAKITFFLAYY